MYEWFSIVIGSLILEDPTTLLVSTRVQDGHLTWLYGGTALFVGILLGDIMLYTIGYLARAGVIRKKDLSRLEQPVSGLYIFAARFAPGLRIVVYTSTGFFKYPFFWFFIINSLSCVIWSVALIYLGAQLYAYTGWWGVGGVIALFIIWQVVRRVLSGRKKRDVQ